MATDLSDLVLDEVSLVDEPANPEARAIVVKAKGKAPKGDDGDPEDRTDGGADEDEEDGNGKPKGKAMPFGKIAAAVLDALAELSPQIVEKAMAGLGTADRETAAAAALIIKETAMDMEALQKSLADAEVKIADLTKAAAEAKAASEQKDAVIKAKDAEIATLAKRGTAAADEEAELIKSLPENLRKRLEAAATAEAEAKAVIAKAAAEKEEAEAIAKAKELKVGDAEKVGKALLRVAKGTSTKEDADLFEGLLKQASEIASKSPLFKALGSGAAVEGDPEALLKAKAEEIQKAKPALSYQQAYSEALEANPELYNAYVAKRRT